MNRYWDSAYRIAVVAVCVGIMVGIWFVWRARNAPMRDFDAYPTMQSHFPDLANAPEVQYSGLYLELDHGYVIIKARWAQPNHGDAVDEYLKENLVRSGWAKKGEEYTKEMNGQNRLVLVRSIGKGAALLALAPLHDPVMQNFRNLVGRIVEENSETSGNRE